MKKLINQKSYILNLEDLIDIGDINFDNTLSNKKSYKNIYIYHFGYKIPYSIKAFAYYFSWNKSYIKFYWRKNKDVLEKYKEIFDNIKYPIKLKIFT